VTPRTS